MRGAAAAGACIIACMRSMKAARPDGILSAPRSPCAVEHAVGQRLLVPEQMQDAVLDRSFADEIDDGDRARLVLAPGAGDALLELRRIPRQIDIDDGARRLQVQPDAAAVGREEQPAGGVLLEAVDLGAAALLRHRAGMPRRFDAHLAGQLAHQLAACAPIRRRR